MFLEKWICCATLKKYIILSDDLLQYKYLKPKSYLWVLDPSTELLAGLGVCVLDTHVFGA